MSDEKPETIEEITKKLGEADKQEKKGKKDREKYRAKFFQIATKRAGDPATFTGRVYGPTEAEARARAEQYYPACEVTAIEGQDGDEDYYGVILQEKPEFQPYTYVNPEDGQVYRRQVVAGSTMFDDELLEERDPDLYERVTKEETKRVLRDQGEIDAEDLAKLSEYIYEGPPQIKLPAPRKAKPEELE
jgi:hypothetical protein